MKKYTINPLVWEKLNDQEWVVYTIFGKIICDCFNTHGFWRSIRYVTFNDIGTVYEHTCTSAQDVKNKMELWYINKLEKLLTEVK